MSNNHQIVTQLLLTLAITSTPSMASGEPGPNSNKRVLTQEEVHPNYIAGYLNSSIPVKLANNSGFPFAQFIISFDAAGSGHLQARDNSEHPQKPIYKKPGLTIWDQRISFNEEQNKLSKLSLDSATKLFGKPKKIIEANALIYTFEVSDIPGVNMQQQIYTVDMKFDDKGIVQSYRVSGPRISNPTWISN